MRLLLHPIAELPKAQTVSQTPLGMQKHDLKVMGRKSQILVSVLTPIAGKKKKKITWIKSLFPSAAPKSLWQNRHSNTARTAVSPHKLLVDPWAECKGILFSSRLGVGRDCCASVTEEGMTRLSRHSLPWTAPGAAQLCHMGSTASAYCQLLCGANSWTSFLTGCNALAANPLLPQLLLCTQSTLVWDHSLSASSFLLQPSDGLISNTNNFLKKEMAPIWTKSPLPSLNSPAILFIPKPIQQLSLPSCCVPGPSISIFLSALLSLGLRLEGSSKVRHCNNIAPTPSGLTRLLRKAWGNLLLGCDWISATSEQDTTQPSSPFLCC